MKVKDIVYKLNAGTNVIIKDLNSKQIFGSREIPYNIRERKICGLEICGDMFQLSLLPKCV